MLSYKLLELETIQFVLFGPGFTDLSLVKRLLKAILKYICFVSRCTPGKGLFKSDIKGYFNQK